MKPQYCYLYPRRHSAGSALISVMLIGVLIGLAAYYFSQALLNRKRESEALGLNLARNTVVHRFEAVFGANLNPNFPNVFTDAIVLHHSRVIAGDQNIKLAHCVFDEGVNNCETGTWIPIRLFTAAAAAANATIAIATPIPTPNPKTVVDPGGPLPSLIVAAGEASGNNRSRTFYNRRGDLCNIDDNKPNEQCPIEATAEFCAVASNAAVANHTCPTSTGNVDQAGRILVRVTVQIAPEIKSKFPPMKPTLIQGDYTSQEILSAVK